MAKIAVVRSPLLRRKRKKNFPRRVALSRVAKYSMGCQIGTPRGSLKVSVRHFHPGGLLVATDPNKQRVAIRYQADDGNFYSVVTSKNHADAVAATGALATDPPLPTKWKARHINLLQVLTGHDRALHVVAPNPTTGQWTGITVGLNVQPFGQFEITGRTGERRTQGAPGYDGNANPPNERVSIRYRSDNGQDYAIVTTRSHAFAVSAVNGSGFPAFPKIWTPRHYNLISPILTGRDQHKTLIEGDPNAAAWRSDAGYAFTVAGAVFNSTGRKDEDRPRGAPSYVP